MGKIKLNGLPIVCKEIKASHPAIPVILVSANSKYLEKLEECSADANIEKPFSINDMLFKINQLLSK